MSAETVEVLDGAAVVAAHPRGRKGDEMLMLDHYLEVLARKPGAMLASTPLASARASGAFSRAHQQFWDRARRRLGDRDGTKAMIELLFAQRTIPAEAISSAITLMLAVDVVDPAVVIVEARRQMHAPVASVIPIGMTLAAFDRPTPAIDHYDDLLEAR